VPGVGAAVVAAELGRGRAAALAATALAGCTLLALVDPDEGGPYPTCPTRLLLGLDCPACGTLRGVHAAAHGRLLEALDHNLLLLVALPLAALLWLRWVAEAAGRPPRPLTWPRWALPVAVVVAVTFAVVRNLPGAAPAWLASTA
jgi:hypothetical protein